MGVPTELGFSAGPQQARPCKYAPTYQSQSKPARWKLHVAQLAGRIALINESSE